MTTQQQTERDEREMLARWLTDTLEYVQNPENVANRDRLLALLRGDEPAEPDADLVNQVWREIEKAMCSYYGDDHIFAAKVKPIIRRIIVEAEERGREKKTDLSLDAYYAGSMPDYGDKTDWWWDYIRAELGRAHDFYQAQIDAPASPVAEPAKPDRYVVAWEAAMDEYVCGGWQAAAAVLRRHFEPPSEVVETAEFVRDNYRAFLHKSPHILANHILKGDQ